MILSDVHYAHNPDVTVTVKGKTAVVEIPTEVEAVEREDGTEYIAATVYVVNTKPTPNLKERVLANIEKWKRSAVEPEKEPGTTLDDVVEGLNALAEIVLGGME